MAKTKKSKTIGQAISQYDGVFALKLALYVVLGSIWLRISQGGSEFPIPLGLIIGMILTTHERLKIDRKIDYAVLIVAALIGYWTNIGLYIAF